MIRRQALVGAGVALVALVGAWCVSPAPRPTATFARSGASLSDTDFWALVRGFSEPEGYFRSDNLVSNELAFQQVIPELKTRAARGGVYLGVGPEQNFTYIVALQPRLAFIIDIRRQNLVLHLLYKTLIEMSEDRVEFVSRLFSRPRPPGLGPGSSAREIFEAFMLVAPSRELFQRNLRSVTSRLVHDHGFDLGDTDLHSLGYVYDAFFSGGPELSYSFPRGFGRYGRYGGYSAYGWRRFPTYAALMQETDGTGEARSFLSTEARFQVLRTLERENRVVPVVGDFAGDKALRAVGTYLRQRHATVTAFYTSNVEQYLFRGDDWRRFFANVATLPIDDDSTFIRAYFNPGFRYAPGSMGPRSATLLNPIGALLRAFDAGRITTYEDVIDLSAGASPAHR
jgi:hypothetical protein